MYAGKLGRDLPTEEGSDAAKHTVFNLLVEFKNYLGNLDTIYRIVKLLVFVKRAEGFNE